MMRGLLTMSRRPPSPLIARSIVCLGLLLAAQAQAQTQSRSGAARDEPLPTQLHWEPPASPEREHTASSPPASSAGNGRAAAPRMSSEQLRAALQRYAREPSVERVIEAALARAPEGRAAPLASRARTAGWVPTVALRARRGQGVDLSHALADDALDLSTDDELTLEAALTFELDRVVFRSEEVALARQTQSEADARAARVRAVIALYFERRRLQLERDLATSADLQRTLRIAEIEALLDVLTDGAFGRLLAAARPRGAAR
jgi:hypothetical protein